MQDADPTRRAREEQGSEVLELLADALLGRVERLITERVDRAAGGRSEPIEDRWLKVSEVAERVGACERTVYRALHSGALEGERLGSHWRIRPAAVDAWLAGSHGRRAATRRSDGSRAASPTAGAARARAFKARARALRRMPTDVQPTPNGRGGAHREEPDEQAP